MNFDWIVDSVTYSISDKTNFRLLKHQGLIYPPLHRLSQRGPQQDGDTDVGYRLDPRIITLKIGIYGSNLEDFYETRSLLSRIFKPTITARKLLLTLGTTKRQIDCHCLEIAEGNRSHLWEEYGISLKANDPTFYDPEIEEVYFELGGGSNTLKVPMEVPMLVGTANLNVIKAITYQGDEDTYPIIYIYGPITDPIITNTTIDEKLDFTGITIGAGSWYKIDTRYSQKTVEDENGDNVIDELTNDSDIAGFKISSETVGGVNSFTVTGTSVDENTNIKIEYYTRFTGV